MAKGKIPGVFLSSTCYDLAQIRLDLKEFIEELGYDPLLSEYESFPVDPELGTVENCMKVVEEQADIFILVVGGRYGFQTDEGKSITNLEFFRAKAKGIPIYIFVKRSILDTLPIWRDNPQGNFKSVVDSEKLFEFVDSLMGKENMWVFPFNDAQDISKILKKQFAYLFYNSLLFRKKLSAIDESSTFADLSSKALRIIIEKPVYWELRLFNQLLIDGIKSLEDLRRDVQYNIVMGKGKKYNNFIELTNWLKVHIDDLLRTAENMGQLINIAMNDAMMKSDPELIVYIGKKFISQYEESIKWSMEFKKIITHGELQKLLDTASRFNEDMIRKVENFSENFDTQLTQALVDIQEGKDVFLNLVIKFDEPVGLQDFSSELDNVRANLLS